MSQIPIPSHLEKFCDANPESREWLITVPETLDGLITRWELSVQELFSKDVTCSWVAAVKRKDGSPAVLKLGLPHFEALDEARGLQFLNGDPTVRLLEFDEGSGALLMERCMPGIALNKRPLSEQHSVLAGILKRIWKDVDESDGFRPLSLMVENWNQECLAACADWEDPSLAREGVTLKRELAAEEVDSVLLATDLHAGNVLAAEREEWLAIDPKPFFGDRTYDGTQHLLNCLPELEVDPEGVIRHFAELLEIDAERLKSWLFARLVSEFGGTKQRLARSIR